MSRSLFAAATLAAAAVTAAAPADLITLFDVSFDDQAFFAVPETGSAGIPRTTLSHVQFGDPKVYPTFGGLTEIPLVFDGGDQVRIWPYSTPESAWYELTFELQLDDGNIHPFELGLFAPNKRTLMFDTENSRMFMVHSDGSWNDLGSMDPSDPLSVRVIVDREFNALIVHVDGEEVFRGFGDDWGAITQVAFGTSSMNASSFLAGVDDIRFRAVLPPCPGDVDADRAVDIDDLLALLSSWGDFCVDCPQDVDGDNQIGLGDLIGVLANWGSCDG